MWVSPLTSMTVWEAQKHQHCMADCVWGKTYDYNLVICSILAEREHAMQVMAIQDQKAILSCGFVLCCRIEIVPKPCRAQLLVGPTIWRDGYAVGKFVRLICGAKILTISMNLALQRLSQPHSEFHCWPWNITEGWRTNPPAQMVLMTVMSFLFSSSIE